MPVYYRNSKDADMTGAQWMRGDSGGGNWEAR